MSHVKLFELVLFPPRSLVLSPLPPIDGYNFNKIINKFSDKISSSHELLRKGKFPTCNSILNCNFLQDYFARVFVGKAISRNPEIGAQHGE